MIRHIDYTNANADLFTFDCGEGVKEYHTILHTTDCRQSFHDQLNALMNAYQQLIEKELKVMFAEIAAGVMAECRSGSAGADTREEKQTGSVKKVTIE